MNTSVMTRIPITNTSFSNASGVGQKNLPSRNEQPSDGNAERTKERRIRLAKRRAIHDANAEERWGRNKVKEWGIDEQDVQYTESRRHMGVNEGASASWAQPPTEDRREGARMEKHPVNLPLQYRVIPIGVRKIKRKFGMKILWTRWLVTLE